MSDQRRYGRLQPIRDVLAGLADWESTDRENRGENDDVVRALVKVRARLEAALTEAEDPDVTLSPKEYAELTGKSVWTVYRNWRQIPGAEKDPHSKEIRIPLAAA